MSDYFEQIFYDEYYRTHSGKSDSELREIILTNSRKIVAMPMQPSPQMLAEAKKWQAESKACDALLTERRSQKEALEAALEDWKSNEGQYQVLAPESSHCRFFPWPANSCDS